MSDRILRLTAHDLRFPTSATLDGSDAMNVAPDYSAAYVVVETAGGAEGYGFTFTCGNGNQLCVAAIEALAPLVVGWALEEVFADMGVFYRHVAGDFQLRWLGPEKGVIHLATAAVLNALWDLRARQEGKPLWRLLADMPPEEVVRCIDFRHIRDALTPEEAVAMLRVMEGGKAARIEQLLAEGYPAYTTSAGWLGYDEAKVRRLLREGLAGGWRAFKQKVGADVEADIARARIFREEIGEDAILMMDANQVWEVDEAIEWMKRLAEFRPLWIEEPVSPDDVLGHARVAEALRPLGIGVATGEHGHNRVMFKQFLQARAMDYCQLDAARLGSVNEVLAVLLLAAKAGVAVCPHGGGVGLCELTQHIAMFDFVAVSGTREGRLLEYVDHLHEHFADPVRMDGPRYRAPLAPGYSARILEQSVADHTYPGGRVWADAVAAETGRRAASA